MQQIRITLKSFDSHYLSLVMKHIINIAYVLDIKTIKRIDLPKKRKKITVLRSPHIDKKSREQFEIKHNKSVLIFYIKNKLSAFLFFECLKNSQIYGVELSIDIYSTSFYYI